MKLLLRFWRWLISPFVRRPAPVVVRVASMGEVPADLGAHIFVVGDRQHPKWVVLACPCPNHERIDVNLMRSRTPSWSLEEVDGGVSLHPSLWMPRDGCGSHFWLVENRVIWVHEE